MTDQPKDESNLTERRGCSLWATAATDPRAFLSQTRGMRRPGNRNAFGFVSAFSMEGKQGLECLARKGRER